MSRLVGSALAAWMLAALAGCRGVDEPNPARPAPDDGTTSVPAPEPSVAQPGEGDPDFERALQQRLGGPVAPAPETPVERRRALEAYEAARVAIVERGELGAGIARLEEAVSLDPGFGEAWYELGTARVTQALQEIASGREQDAVVAYRRGIEEQRRARDELRTGNARVDDAFAWHDKLSELEATLAEAELWLDAPGRLPSALLGRAQELGFVPAEPASETPEGGPSLH